MKKITAILLPALILTPTVVLAAPGDIAGDIYSTDIKTYFFDNEINSYNIGGQTVIVAEDLALFGGISVEWNSADRKLIVTDDFRYHHSDNPQATDHANLPVSYPDGYFDRSKPKHIYTTDIVTEYSIDGSTAKLASYNIGGYTCIVVEDLMARGYSVTWDGDARELRVNHDYSDRVIETDIGRALSDGKLDPSAVWSATSGKMTFRVEGEPHELKAFTYKPAKMTLGHTYMKLTDFCGLTGTKYEFKDNILTIDTSGAKEYGWNFLNDLSREITADSFELLYLEKFIADGEETELGCEWQLMDGGVYQAPAARAMIVDGDVYVPFDRIDELIDRRKSNEDKAPETGLPEENNAEEQNV